MIYIVYVSETSDGTTRFDLPYYYASSWAKAKEYYDALDPKTKIEAKIVEQPLDERWSKGKDVTKK